MAKVIEDSPDTFQGDTPQRQSTNNSPPIAFEEDPDPHQKFKEEADSLRLSLQGFEGPIDMLLVLARGQKVDLSRISILDLATQYLAFIEKARRIRLELAADYLVMAAWLAYMKSRLLLPDPPEDDEPSGEEMAARLAFQLRRLGAMQKYGGQLMEYPQKGWHFHLRGAPESTSLEATPVYTASLYDLLRAYATQQKRAVGESFKIAPSELYSVDTALERLTEILGTIPDWKHLNVFLPDSVRKGRIFRKSALASMFVASLEMVKQGTLEVRQDQTYGPIYVRKAAQDTQYSKARATAAKRRLQGDDQL